MNHKLILLEGLPGTGKTTLANWLHNYLCHHGYKTTLLSEGNIMIPCDYYETAVLTWDEYQMITKEYENYIYFFEKYATSTENYVYVRLDRCPTSLYGILQKWNMGDELNRTFTDQEYANCTLERLHHWVRKVRESDYIYIIDGGFLKSPIHQLLCRNADSSFIHQFILQIFHILLPFHPFCIYLQRETSKETIAYAKRIKGDVWTLLTERYNKETTYEDIYEQRLQIEQRVLQSVEHMTCQIYGYDWASIKGEILKNLQRDSSK